MGPRVRRTALTAHVVASVGWLGAVAAFLALALAGLRGGDAPAARAAYVAMGVTAAYVIVPLSLASLATGVLQGLGTPWGLFRHWWVVAKLLVNVVSTLALLVHLRPIAHLADAAASGALGADLGAMRLQLVLNAGAALVALVTATALAVHKPRGLTPYGWRKQQARAAR